jgi:predicted DNA-binding ribbon-helix-helix protein
MKSLVIKRSIVVGGHKTSVSLEEAFWTALKQIASSRELTLSKMVAIIDAGRANGNLSSAIRVFVLDQFRGIIADVDTGRSQDSSLAGPAGTDAAAP